VARVLSQERYSAVLSGYIRLYGDTALAREVELLGEGFLTGLRTSFESVLLDVHPTETRRRNRTENFINFVIALLLSQYYLMST